MSSGKILPSGESIFTNNGDISTRAVFSVRIGQESGKVLEYENNTFMGYSAGYASRFTKDCVFMGRAAGGTLYSGSSNIILGESTLKIYKDIEQLLSIGFNKSDKQCISIGYNLQNYGGKNVSMGYIINSTAYNAFTYGNDINVNSSKYFKDSLENFNSNIITDGVRKFGLKDITWNNENNLIYKDNNKAGYDIISSNIANSIDNSVNLNTITYNIPTYNIHLNYLPYVNNYTSYIINSFGILLINNSEISIISILPSQLITAQTAFGPSTQFEIQDDISINLSELDLKKINIPITLTANNYIYNLINLNDKIIPKINIIKRVAKPFIANSFTDYTDIYINVF